jgi:beta-glucosidase
VPPELLNTDGNPGVRASYYALNDMFALLGRTAPRVPLAIRTEPGIGLSTDALPPEIAGKNLVVVVWEAALVPQATGDYNFGLRGEGFFRVSINGTPVTMAFNTNGAETKLGRVHFEAGKMYALKVEYGLNPHASEPPCLVWAKRVPGPTPEGIAAAKDADVVVAVVGITSELEGEEMLVSEDGFKGGDRTSLDLPKPEQDLLEGVASTGKPLVVVLLNGSALSVNWVKEHANAILESWYPGEEGGAAIAQTLAGVNNPSGRLPVTFYTGVGQLPPFEDYSMANRTYRYFTGTPLYPFGYGLSYSKFAYSSVKLSAKNLQAGKPLNVDANVKNTGQRDGDEVVELYLTFPKLPGAPIRALRGFTRVHIAAGKTAHVHLTLNPRDLSYVNENGDRLIAPGSYTLSIGGGQPGTAAPVVESGFIITGQMQLPE